MDPSIQEYLERLDARLDAYTNAIRSLAEKLGAHVVSGATSTPAIVHNPPPPTTSPESTTDASAPIPDVSCSTTKAQVIPTVAHDAAPVCIAMVPVTCSTECSTQVDTIDSVDEVHDAATAVHLEPTVDPIYQAVEQLSPVQATASIGTNTPSSAEVVSPVTTTTDVDPKAGVQELDVLSVDTSTQVMSKADHDVALIIPGDPAPRVLTMCSTDGLVQDGEWVKPVHLVDKSKTSCLPPIQQGIGQQPLPSPVRVRTRYSGHLFRPRPWPSFKFHSDASYQEEPCSGIRRQPHDVLWFSSGLVLRLFRDVVFPQVSCCEMISMEESFSCLSGAQLPSWRPPDHATSDAKQSSQGGHSQTVFYPCCRVQSQEVAEWCAHLYASTEFYLEKFACCCLIVPRDIPTLSQPIMQFMGNLYLSDVEGQSAICLVQFSCQLHAQNAEQMFRFSPKNIQLISLSVHRKNLSQEEFNGSVHFTRGCNSDHHGNLSFLLACWTVQHIMRPCFLSEPIPCEVNHGYYLKILRLFAIQAIQFATVLHYSNDSVVRIPAPLMHSSNKLFFSESPVTCQLIDRIHKCRMQYKAAESNKFNCRIQCQCMEHDTYQSSCEIKPGPYLVCANTSRRASMVLLLESPLSSCREFLVGTIVISIAVTCTTKLCSAGGIIFRFRWRMQMWFRVVIHNSEGEKCPVNDFVFTPTSENAEMRSIMVHLKRSVHWQFRGKEEQEGNGTCTGDNMIGERQEVISTMLSAIINCYCMLQHSAMRVVNNELWCFYHPHHNCPAALLGLQKLANLQLRMKKAMTSGGLNQWMAIICLCGALELDHVHDKPVELLGFLSTFSCQALESTRSDTIWVLGALEDPGSFMAVQGGDSISASTQEHLQGGRGVIVVAAVFMQGYADHEYYLGFDRDGTDNGYVIDTFFDSVSFGHNSYFSLVEVYLDSDQGQEQRVQWDPGGSRWCWLGVKPNFKEGGMSGTFPSPYMYLG